jgi:hypothetical protein
VVLPEQVVVELEEITVVLEPQVLPTLEVAVVVVVRLMLAQKVLAALAAPALSSSKCQTMWALCSPAA